MLDGLRPDGDRAAGFDGRADPAALEPLPLDDPAGVPPCRRGVSAVGGMWPGLVGSVAASLIVNWFFTPPIHTWTIAEAENVVALFVFIVRRDDSQLARVGCRAASCSGRPRSLGSTVPRTAGRRAHRIQGPSAGAARGPALELRTGCRGDTSRREEGTGSWRREWANRCPRGRRMEPRP